MSRMYKGQRLYKSTKDQVRFFKKHPEVVARVYHLNSHGNTVSNIHDIINDETRGYRDFVRMTPTTSRKLLHKEFPFDDACLFKQVDPEDAEWVKRRFRSTSYNVEDKPKKAPKSRRSIRKRTKHIEPLGGPPELPQQGPPPRPLQVPLIKEESITLALAALNAYIQYQNALTTLQGIGVSKASMDSWCALTIGLFNDGDDSDIN